MRTKFCANCGREFSRHPKHSNAQWEAVRHCGNACASPRKTLAFDEYEERDCGFDTACWIFASTPRDNGYCVTMHNGTSQYAHRLFYEHFKGPVSDGLELDHLCRVRACVNPDHLEAVTHAENMRRGNTTKLTWADIQAIRASTETTVALGKRFAIHHGHVSRIKAGHIWKEDG